MKKVSTKVPRAMTRKAVRPAYDPSERVSWFWLAWMLAVVLFDEFKARVTNRYRPMKRNQFRDSQAFMLDQPEKIS